MLSRNIHLPMPSTQDILRLLERLRGGADGEVSLGALAARAGWSPFHVHRAFRRVVGETPKQYILRLRLERAAARLATGPDPVRRIALDAGFASHEVFTRAFTRRFGCTPSAYRAAAGTRTAPASRVRHVSLTDATSPCVGLYHMPVNERSSSPAMPMLSIERRELIPAHVLFVRARCARSEISRTIGECLGKAFPYAMRIGAPLAGRPFTRYTSVGPGLLTIDAGCVVAAPTPGEGEVEATTLPGGAAVVAMHAGSYDTLAETYAGMERWAERHGYAFGGAPWESYITDPAEHADPAEWRTEIFWPLADR